MKLVIDGTELGYDDQGAGTPVVLVHGFPFSRQMWRGQVAALSRSWRVITPDLRGFGESGGVPASLEELAEDLHGLIEQLDLPRFVLGGFSMGGYVAFRYLAAHADRVRAVMLLDTRAEADSPEARQRRYAGIERIKAEGPQGFLDDFLKAMVSPTTLEMRAELAAEVRAMMESKRVDSLTGGLRAMAERPDSTPLLAKIRVPTMIVVGELDKATPVDSARKMHEAIPGSSLVIVPQAAHVSNYEQPERFNEAVTEFLRTL